MLLIDSVSNNTDIKWDYLGSQNHKKNREDHKIIYKSPFFFAPYSFFTFFSLKVLLTPKNGSFSGIPWDPANIFSWQQCQWSPALNAASLYFLRPILAQQKLFLFVFACFMVFMVILAHKYKKNWFYAFYISPIVILWSFSPKKAMFRLNGVKNGRDF